MPAAAGLVQTRGDGDAAKPAAAGGANQAATAAIKLDTKGYPAPEKVHVLDPKIARTHTTFYG